MKAKKSFGQHFLVNEHIAQKIANSLIRSEGYKNVLEVGPGKGVLTKYLAQQDIHLKVVEADQDMVTYLTTSKIVKPEQIIFLDFLKLSMEKVFEGAPFYLIGNYPYNISSQILIRMIHYRELIPEMVGMFQKEVAERIVAAPGDDAYGRLAVIAQAVCEAKLVMHLPAAAFTPPPKVASAVVHLVPREDRPERALLAALERLQPIKTGRPKRGD
jgi:16S rRNA (adenine1518-N6/adenine1519-N6)-dimethyltransferase